MAADTGTGGGAGLATGWDVTLGNGTQDHPVLTGTFTFGYAFGVIARVLRLLHYVGCSDLSGTRFLGATMSIRSRPVNVLIAKVWGTFLAGCSVLVFGRNFPSYRFLITLPFLFAACFFVSLAILEVRDGVVRYKRWFKWTTIPRDEIVSGRVEIATLHRVNTAQEVSVSVG